MSAKRRIIPVFIPHLGCRHDCVFCDQRGISGTFSPPIPEDVSKNITEALKNLSHGEVVETAFYGGSFTAIPKLLQTEFLNAANKALFEVRGCLRISTRPDCIDTETVRWLVLNNVRTIELGAQSMDENVLKASARGHTAEDTRNAAKAVKDGGAELILQMMTGLPCDTSEKSIKTARELIRLSPDGVRIYPAVVMRGTRLYELWKSGTYKEHTVEEAVELCAKLCRMFDDGGIPVIRIGLNPTDGLSTGGAVAGAYHPAFGELVRSRIYLEQAREMMHRAGVRPGNSVTLTVGRGMRSIITGQRRCNLNILKSEFGLRSVSVSETGEKDKIISVDVENSCEIIV